MAQLTAPGSVATKTVTYPSLTGRTDPAFIYCNSSGTVTGSLTADWSGHGGTRTFKWYMWNDGTSSFSTLLHTDPGVTVSTISGLSEGGFKVDIENAGIPDTSMTCWIFFDKPPLASASLAQQLCYRVALSGTATATVDKFNYKDIGTGAALTLKNDVKHVWSSTPDSYIPAPDVYLNPVIQNYPPEPPFQEYRLPLEDVVYKLTVSTAGCSAQSSFPYTSIHVKADFSADPVEGEAPLEVQFVNKSVRASTYQWNFGDKTKSDIETPDLHTYKIPGKYTVTLIIESDNHCLDSLRSDSLIYVKPSKLGIPNAFTPNDDGYNDRFMIFGQSLRYVSMEVFSQSGIQVYGFSGEGEALKNWNGWDGHINNTSALAKPGIYFYIISAVGWDDVKYNSKKYRGFVYLYR